MQQLTTEQLKEKMQNGENFVLDLYATWCGPCKIMLTNLEKVNESLIKESTGESKYKIYKYDIDTDKEFVVSELGIRSVPTIKIFKEGKEVFSRPGVMTPSEVLGLISE
jgi:thioredoxin-like negative regulator of GroEL